MGATTENPDGATAEPPADKPGRPATVPGTPGSAARVGLRADLPTGEAIYVSAFTHAQFHATPFVHEALSFASPMQLKQWASEQGAANRHHLARFRPCPIEARDLGAYDAAMAGLLGAALAAGLADADARERSEAEKARKAALLAASRAAVPVVAAGGATGDA